MGSFSQLIPNFQSITSNELESKGNNFSLSGDQNDTTFEQQDFPCYEISELDWEYVDSFAFWVEGIMQCILAISGIFGNSISTFILLKKNMRNSFNSLLIALTFMDTCYLIGAILESFRKCFSISTYLHIQMFPYFLYPGINIAFTSSVVMRVGIAIERYITVHHPIEHRTQINNTGACRRRLLKYVGAVIFTSVLINIPKFFDSQVNVEYTNTTYHDREFSITKATIDYSTNQVMNISDIVHKNKTLELYF